MMFLFFSLPHRSYLVISLLPGDKVPANLPADWYGSDDSGMQHYILSESDLEVLCKTTLSTM